jgi:large subunit ribosomal protein L29
MAEAQKELADNRKQLFHLRLQLSRGEVKNNRQFAQLKAEIARLMYHVSELNRQAAAEHEEDEADTAENTATSKAKA